MVKHLPGIHGDVGSNPTTATVENKSRALGYPPTVQQDLSGRPAVLS